MAWRIGIDIGGTFTDLAATELDSGELYLRKVPSTPANLAEGAVAGIESLGQAVALEVVSFLAHGTTAGTNALIEGTGARTGLITTSGFRDLLAIGRQQRPSLYDLRAGKPQSLVSRRLRREVTERIRFDGSIMKPLDVSATKRELGFLREEGIESLAICFLHSYANPSHERAVRDLAQRLLPEVYVTASCDLLPRFREYERLSTTVVNAYLGPLMNRYLDELSRGIARAGMKATPNIMQSNGGLTPIEEARRKPASTVLSGPAAGAAAAADLCTQLGVDCAIAVDMGGTSTDLCVIEGGLPASAAGREVGGYAVELPGVDVRCIGAGGGSIISVDAAGLPQVGPRSAGAHPGPACYGRGGSEPTLTDAFLALGRIAPSGLLGGEISLDLEAARGVLGEKVAKPLGVGGVRAALGAAELAVDNVRRAVEAITVAKGRDPRDHVLIAAGGAGPLVACELAAELHISEVIVPSCPGNFSAYGLLTSDLRRDWVKTHLLAASAEQLPELIEGFRALEREAERWLKDNVSHDGGWLVLRRAAARYVGQDYELEVEVPSGRLTRRQLAQVAASFHEAHERCYGYSLPRQPIEFVDLSVTAVGTVSRPRSVATAAPSQLGRGCVGSRLVFVRGREEPVRCSVYDRRRLRLGETVDGPAMIEQYDSTTYLPPGYRARVDVQGNLRVKAAVLQ